MNLNRFFKTSLPKLVICISLASFIFSLPAKAEESSGSSQYGADLDSRQALQRILVNGLYGGILGLSTLSFYSHPEDHVKNITWGAAAGMIVAALYLTFDAASNPTVPGAGGTESTPQSFYLLPDFDFQSTQATLKLGLNF